MANYDKDMAEERIQIKDDKQKIYEDDKKKRETPFNMYDKDSALNMYDKDSALNMYDKDSALKMSDELKYGGPVIDQMQTLSQAGAMKILKHSKSKM